MKTRKPDVLHCPQAYRGEHMRIFCRKIDDACKNQRWCGCCGWYILNEQSYTCPLAKGEKKNGTQSE